MRINTSTGCHKDDTNNLVFYLFADHLGSTNVVTDPSGGMVSLSLYKSWGRKAGAGIVEICPLCHHLATKPAADVFNMGSGSWENKRGTLKQGLVF
jgi:hypothetical protein